MTDTKLKPSKTKAERAQFKMQFFVMMQNAGREEEALKSFNEGMQLLEQFNNGDTQATTDY